jgi:hypothetical protein
MTANTSAQDFRELIFELVVDFLDSDDPQAVRTAARIIRRNKEVYGNSSKLDTIVETLTNITEGQKITTASEASLTLGFLLSTRPRDRDLPNWDGSDPLSQQGMKDLDQRRLVPETPNGPGFLDKVNNNLVDDAIDALIDNVDRKDYKRSANWDVGEACTLSIGFIGYQAPERVGAAVPILLQAANKNDTNVRTIYALTSIGYSRPDLLSGDIISRIEALVNNVSGNVLWGQVGIQKIDHAPTWLGRIGTYPGPDLEPIFEKLFRFMLGKYPLYNDEVSNAVIDIVAVRPNDAVTVLADELQRVVNGNNRTITFRSNLISIEGVIERFQ